MDFGWKELWSYIVGFLGMCEGLTNLFALFIVVVTLFFITIPHAIEVMGRRKDKKQ